MDDGFIAMFIAIWLIFYGVGSASILSWDDADNIEIEPLELTNYDSWTDSDGFVHLNISFGRESQLSVSGQQTDQEDQP